MQAFPGPAGRPRSAAERHAMGTGFERIAGDIWRLKVPFGGDWTGIVLIDGPEKILIDSGSCAADADSVLVPALAARGLKPSEIGFLCCTHCHGDHVGGHSRFLSLSGACAVCGEASAPKLRDPLFYSRQIRNVFPENSPPAPAVLEGVSPGLILRNGEMLADRLQLVETPGHDTDCVSWLDRDTGFLITGDSLQGNGTVIQGTALYTDVGVYRAALRRVQEICAEGIVSGHSFTMAGDLALGRGETETYLARCMLVTEIYEDYIGRAFRNGTKDPVTIARGLIEFMGNRVPGFLFLPLYTVTAHLRLQEAARTI